VYVSFRMADFFQSASNPTPASASIKWPIRTGEAAASANTASLPASSLARSGKLHLLHDAIAALCDLPHSLLSSIVQWRALQQTESYFSARISVLHPV